MNKCSSAYEYLVWFGSLLKSPLLLLLRLYFGGMFIYAGWSKLQDIPHFAAMLEAKQFMFPHFQAYLAALTEFLGGICLVIGFASRLVAIPLIIVMLVAYMTMSPDAVKNIFIAPADFIAQSPFNYLLTCLIVLAFGPGRFSIDYLIERCCKRCCKKS